MACFAEQRDLPFDRIAAQSNDLAVFAGLSGGELRQNGDPKTCGNEGPDGLKFTAFAGDARLEPGLTAGGKSGVACSAFVEHKGFLGQFH